MRNKEREDAQRFKTARANMIVDSNGAVEEFDDFVSDGIRKKLHIKKRKGKKTAGGEPLARSEIKLSIGVVKVRGRKEETKDSIDMLNEEKETA